MRSVHVLTATATLSFALLCSAGCGPGAAKQPAVAATPPAPPPAEPADDDAEDPAAPAPPAKERKPAAEYSVGKFVRFELVSKTPDEAAAFYRGLFGWQIDATKDDGDAVYSIRNDGQTIGRIRRYDDARKLPAGWVSWISVEDPPDVLRDVEANGGTIEEVPRRVRNEQRALARGPAGGTFGLVRADDGDEPDRDGRAGDWFWSQLWSTDFDAAVSFYEVIAGYTSVEHDYGKLVYRVLLADDVPRAVIVQAPPKQASRWIPFVHVDNVGATVKSAKQSKAKVITEPRDVEGIGRLAVLQAPTGGIFGVIEPDVQDGDR